MPSLMEGVEYKWVDIADCSFGELHTMLEKYEQQGWELERVVGQEQMPETSLYGQPGALQLWLRRVNIGGGGQPPLVGHRRTAA